YDERYPDFGPTLAAEYLAEEGLKVDHETLRRWLLAKGKPRRRRRRQRHREWRERKPCFGAMVQLDGSHHDWFEGRAPKCVLMVMVDDATNRVWAQFFEEETTRASYDILEGWVRRWGLPQSLYVDKDSIYRCEGVGSIAEQIAGKEPQTQFGRAMEQVGVELILANSPQAKGRVERMNGTLQDRLVKALRLAGINDPDKANDFLAKKFLPGFNRQFEVGPSSPADVHRGIPRELDQVLSWQEERVVQKDWTVVHQNQWYQLDRQHELLSLAGKKVRVRTLRDGTVQLERQGLKLRFRRLSERPRRVVEEPEVAKVVEAPAKPAQGHPWRRALLRGGRAMLAPAAIGIGDSGRPPLCSGLPPSPIPIVGTAARTTNNKGTFSPEL
ncbi:MAG TPA: ISNCY family transposase, partial [Candidatus Acidoferrum sp.]|nr:ISNCY family transposase [Candidatus Acidoferrum sp.]